MRRADITFRAKLLASQQKIKRKLTWRDSWRDIKTGELHEIVYEDEGGDIKFHYNPTIKRMIPYVVDIYKPSRTNTYDQLKKLISSFDFPHEVIDDIPNREITIQITDDSISVKNFQQFVDQLEQDMFGHKICDCDINFSRER